MAREENWREMQREVHERELQAVHPGGHRRRRRGADGVRADSERSTQHGGGGGVRRGHCGHDVRGTCGALRTGSFGSGTVAALK